MSKAAAVLGSAVRAGQSDGDAKLRERGKRIAINAGVLLSERVERDQADTLGNDLAAMVCSLGLKHKLTPGEMALLLVTMAEGSMGSVLEENGMGNRRLVKAALVAMVELDVEGG